MNSNGYYARVEKELVEYDVALENRLFSRTAFMGKNQKGLPRPKVLKGQCSSTSAKMGLCYFPIRSLLSSRVYARPAAAEPFC